MSIHQYINITLKNVFKLAHFQQQCTFVVYSSANKGQKEMTLVNVICLRGVVGQDSVEIAFPYCSSGH